MANPILEQTKAAILKKVDPRIVPAVKKTEAAGVKVMNAPQMQQMIQQQLGGGNDPEAIGAGVAKVAALVLNQSKGQLPPSILMPAAALILCDGLQALEEVGKVRVDNDFLAECTKSMGSSLAQMYGATPDKLQGVVDKVKGQGGQGQPGPGQPAQPAQPAPPAPGGGIVANAQGGM